MPETRKNHDDMPEDDVPHDGNVQRLSSAVARGFKDVGAQIADFKGETRAEISSVAQQINELRTQMAPIMQAFAFGKDNISERLIRLEEKVKQIDADVTGAKSRVVALAISAVTALVAAVWSLIQSHIALK